MAGEDYCSGCARAFPADELTERGSELLCAECAAGEAVEDPELARMRQRLGKSMRLPGVLDLVVTAGMAVLLAVGWAVALAPTSFWWALFLAVAPGSIGVYLKLRADTDNRGTLVWALALGGLTPILGFAAHLALHGEAMWIALFLIPFGAAIALMGAVRR